MKFKKLIALFLSLVLIMGVVIFPANAENDDITSSADDININEDYSDSITRPGAEGSVDYLKFTTIDKDAYYTIYAKNIDINTHSWSLDTGVQVEIKNANSEEISRIRLLPASEGAVTLKLQPNTTYYMNVYNNFLGDANGGNYKIKITYVLDPDKNEMENATEWSLEEKYYGDIAARDDHDWFKITTNENTDYTFTLKNTNIPTHSWSVDLRFRGVIYNDKNESLATVMLFANEEGSARVTLDPNTTYYIAIFDPQGTTGEYSFDLSVTVIIDKEAVGMANAPEVPYNEDYYDNITNWDEGENVDYLKFTTLSEPAYYTITAKNINIPTHSWSGDNQVQVNIINEHKEVIQRFTLGPEAEGAVTYKFDENTTYFIKINNNENAGGNYKVKITYVLDADNNEMANAPEVPYNEDYYDSITNWDEGENVDYLKFTTLSDPAYYTITVKNINIPTHSWSGDSQVQVNIINEHKEVIQRFTLGPEAEGAVTYKFDENTTYFIKINNNENAGGNYKVKITYVLNADNNEMANAPEVPYNEDYYDSITNWDEDENVDYLKFTTLSDPAYYTITVKNINIPTHSWSGDSQVQVNVWNQHNEELAKLTLGEGKESSVTLCLDKNTTYYIRINNNENSGGIYKVNISYKFDPEPNVNKSSAYQATLDEFYEGNLAAPEDVDWIVFRDCDTTKYRVVLETRGDEAKQLQAMVYAFNTYLDTVNLICGETSDAVVLDAPISKTDYYIYVKGLEGSCGEYIVGLEDVSTVTPENDRTRDSIKFINVYSGEDDSGMIQMIEFDKDYITEIDRNTHSENARYAFLKTEGDDCEYEFWVKNQSIPISTGLAVVEIVKERDSVEPLLKFYLAEGEQQTTTVSLEPYTDYYLKFYIFGEDTRTGGLVEFNISKIEEPETTVATEPTLSTVPPSTAIPTTTIQQTPPVTTTTQTTTTNAETTTSSTANTIPSNQVILGDTDLSGKINIKDATLVQKVLAKLATLDDVQKAAADVTSDGKINIKDATAIQKHLAKIEIPYNVGQVIDVKL